MGPVDHEESGDEEVRSTEEQIAYALKQVELGMAVGEVCRKMGAAEPRSEWAADCSTAQKPQRQTPAGIDAELTAVLVAPVLAEVGLVAMADP